MRSHGLGGRLHVTNVGLLMLVERRRNADGDEIGFRNEREVRGGRQGSFVNQAFEIAVHHIADVVPAFVHHIDFFGLHVKPDGLEPGLGLLHSQRQADIPQTNHATYDFAGFDLGKQVFFHTRHEPLPSRKKALESAARKCTTIVHDTRPAESPQHAAYQKQKCLSCPRNSPRNQKEGDQNDETELYRRATSAKAASGSPGPSPVS